MDTEGFLRFIKKCVTTKVILIKKEISNIKEGSNKQKVMQSDEKF